MLTNWLINTNTWNQGAIRGRNIFTFGGFITFWLQHGLVRRELTIDFARRLRLRIRVVLLPGSNKLILALGKNYLKIGASRPLLHSNSRVLSVACRVS